jgi:hypothetical protein
LKKHACEVLQFYGGATPHRQPTIAPIARECAAEKLIGKIIDVRF